mmetsp:Transcript_12534/g.22767  ORF Transcript_12534/g.22767 Transcript_12534/m.22767 type:complete len:209 (+) Transcript_12534:496-1122(+)
MIVLRMVQRHRVVKSIIEHVIVDSQFTKAGDRGACKLSLCSGKPIHRNHTVPVLLPDIGASRNQPLYSRIIIMVHRDVQRRVSDGVLGLHHRAHEVGDLCDEVEELERPFDDCEVQTIKPLIINGFERAVHHAMHLFPQKARRLYTSAENSAHERRPAVLIPQSEHPFPDIVGIEKQLQQLLINFHSQEVKPRASRVLVNKRSRQVLR